jgi:predicted double-glycine peptidase
MLEIRHENAVIQKWDISCGAAVLANILKYQHGFNVTEKDVALGLIKREEYIKNPDILRIREGFSLLDMKRYAATLGLEGAGFGQLEFKDLVESAPIITIINNDGYRHFVIFRGLAKNRVLLIDPNFGNTTMLKEDFEKIWLNSKELGRVGFVVHRPGEKQSPPGRLLPKLTDYWFFG